MIMRLIPFFLLAILSCAPYLPAQEGNQRIKKLFPNLAPLPNLDPAVPADFTVGYHTEKPDLRAGIYWGSRESITSLFKENTLSQGPVFQIKLSANVTQKNANSFNGEETIFRDMIESGYRNVKTGKVFWGTHPVLVFEGEAPSGDMQYMAWMGLNSPDSSTLRFYLMLEPSQKKHNPTHVEIWRTFLSKTTEHTSPRPNQAATPPSGSKTAAIPETKPLEAAAKKPKEASEGITNFAAAGGQLKVLAERRSSDNRLLVVIEPLNDKTNFEFQELRENSHPSSWSYGKPVLKVYGELSVGGESIPQIQAHIIPVIIKKVDRFSVDYEKLQLNWRNTVILR